MPKPKFNFGDYVYHASVQSVTEPVPCPDCGGKMYVVLALDGESFIIDCEGCKRGWMGSTGNRDHYVYQSAVHEGTIDSIERDWNNPDVVEYRIAADNGGRWVLKEEDTFATREGALAHSEELLAKKQAEEDSRVHQKTKPDKSWVWHVRYYLCNSQTQ